ncbi:MAG: hypothetical protein EP335_14160 [Alphaproteobacteria bacterium]|nr:MAG: hypothetical protein EP335_14160 [Alphaproteobacteria bacterium]
MKVVDAYSKYGTKYFDDTEMKQEGRFGLGTKDGRSAMVWAIKGYPQARLYGCIHGKKNLLVCCQYDQKKTDRANQQKLKMTATIFGEYLMEYDK